MSIHATRLYISGPMTGYPDHNHKTFNHVAAVIKERYNIDYFSPAEIFNGDLTLSRHEYMLEDIRGLIECDAIVMIEGWESSKGASLELEIAKEINLPVYVWTSEHPDCIFLKE